MFVTLESGELTELYDSIEQLESNIKDYQEFLGGLRSTFDLCGEGCTEGEGGRKLDVDYVLEMYHSFELEDDFLEQEIESSSYIQAGSVRNMTDHCKELLDEKRSEREVLLEQRDELEKKVGFDRHPKKDI